MASNIQNNGFYKSFSFRAGLLIFAILCTCLLAIRIFIFYDYIDEEEKETRLVIRSHIQDISEQYKKFGGVHVAELVAAMADEARDSNLIVVFESNGKFFGNYNKFPELPLKNNEWFNFKIKKFARLKNTEVEKNYLAQIVKYNQYDQLIVAHDMNKINREQKKLPTILLQYVAIAIAVSLLISLGIIMLLNKNLRKFNIAYGIIQKGNLEYRIKTGTSNDQFDILSRNFNSMMEWISTLLHTIKDTTNNLAHDLRTPISRHRLSLEAIISSHELPQKAQEDLEASISEIDRVMKIFNNILSISKADDKSGIEEFRNFMLNEVISDLADFFEPLIEERGQTLELKLPEDDVEFFGEPKLLTQAIYNFIDNAIKYNSENGKIKIELKSKDEEIEISVSDEGEGLPQDMLERVKEKFFRLDASRTTEGIGLGLSLVDSVVKLHSGKFILSNITNGTKITGLSAKIILKKQ